MSLTSGRWDVTDFCMSSSHRDRSDPPRVDEVCGVEMGGGSRWCDETRETVASLSTSLAVGLTRIATMNVEPESEREVATPSRSAADGGNTCGVTAMRITRELSAKIGTM